MLSKDQFKKTVKETKKKSAIRDREIEQISELLINNSEFTNTVEFKLKPILTKAVKFKRKHAILSVPYLLFKAFLYKHTGGNKASVVEGHYCLLFDKDKDEVDLTPYFTLAIKQVNPGHPEEYLKQSKDGKKWLVDQQLYEASMSKLNEFLLKKYQE